MGLYFLFKELLSDISKCNVYCMGLYFLFKELLSDKSKCNVIYFAGLHKKHTV
jgi:hypothetical protein